MKHYRLDAFTRGWCVGDFEPSIVRTPAFEFGIKHYQAGDREARHVHRQAEEITVIVSGLFMMNGKRLKTGDIVLIEKNEAADFECLETGATAVIKTPSVMGDKFLVGDA